MSALTEGKLSVVIHLGNIEMAGTSPTRVVGQQCHMEGLSGLIYITPEVAEQWLPVLETIANETSN